MLTITRIVRHLNDSHKRVPVEFAARKNQVFAYGGEREPFVTHNYVPISIQQSAVHHCTVDTFEVFTLEPSPELLAYLWQGRYVFVPLDVICRLVEHLEELVTEEL